MNYVTWKLNFENPEYGTGPEKQIIATGNTAESSWANGDVTAEGRILGYVTDPVDEDALTRWQVQNITQADALAFCQAINPEAYLTQEGKFAAPMHEVE